MRLHPLEPRRLMADVVGLTLVHAQSDQVIGPLTHGATIDLATVGRQLSIRADVAAAQPSGSVRFNFDGNPNHKIESLAPFAIAGDANGGRDYLPWTPTLGTHTLVVTGYAASGGKGERDGSKLLTFQVVDSSPQSPAPTTTIRVNAGGGAYTASSGNVFSADAGFTGGVKSFSTYPVAGTLDDPLHHARRYGKTFTFARPVDNGTYTLTLHFAEPTFTAANQRKFDVSAEGKLVLDDLDLVQSVGARRAATRSFDVTVADGQLNLSFAASINNAIVSAIELVPKSGGGGGGGTQVIAIPAPVRVDVGGAGAIKDSLGRTFEGDTGFTGGAIVQGNFTVPNSDDDALLTTYRSGASFSFHRPIANGNYAVWLAFADPASTAAGQRTFDVTAEGGLVLDDFDVFAAAATPADALGPNAVVRKFDVQVTDGTVDLDFSGVAGDAIVSSIVVIPTDVPPAMLWYAGLGDYADPVLHQARLNAWKVHSASNLRQIGQGILLYANDHRGNYPPTLAAMSAEVDGLSVDAFANPRIPVSTPRGQISLAEKAAWVAEQDGYVYVGAGLRFTAPGTTIVAYENPDTTPGDVLNALYADGHVGELTRATLVAQFGGSPVSPPEYHGPLNLTGDPNVVKSASNLRDIAQALFLYSNDFKGRFPPDLGTLYRTQEIAPQAFLNPRGTTPPPPGGMTVEQTEAWINASTDYVYLAANRSSGRDDGILLYENPAEMKDGINLLFPDGHVEFVEMRWAVELIAAAGAPASA